MDLSADFFSLFQLPRTFSLDSAELDTRYREIQGQVHPDRFTQAGDAEPRLSMQWATQANEAYQTLKNPLERAKYLLRLAGHDVLAESNTAMPTEFLMRQMELREAVVEARAAGDEDALDAVRLRLLDEIKADHQRLAELIDVARNYAAAANLVRQLMFQEKLLNEIEDALEAVTA